MKDVKIVIGANYGDEGKGLMTRYFVRDAQFKGENPVVIFHNGTAQRGHTVDYNPSFRHVYHHFGSGTGDGVPTFFAKTFWIHPMEFRREYAELIQQGINVPESYCDYDALVVTPFDMLIDHATEAWIAYERGEREHGSCGYGTWCATDRFPTAIYTIKDFHDCLYNDEYLHFILEDAWNACIAQMIKRGVDVERLPEYKRYFVPDAQEKKNIITNFINDLRFFFRHTNLTTFDKFYTHSGFDSLIFENGQGLGLDQNCGAEWHTTSNTGMTNPYDMLKDYHGYHAEVCYVSRSYTTRHGIGTLEEEAKKSEINADMIDKTNVPNEFQGILRYGYLADKEQQQRIAKDWERIALDQRFKKTMAITHCNEFADLYQKADYESNNPFSVFKRG